MRHLLTTDVQDSLRRGSSVEQFLGQAAEPGCLRHVELRPSDGLIEVWIYDVEDIGSEDYLDLYAFPWLEPDGPDGPVATFQDPQAAIIYASVHLAADPARWVNVGVAQSEYLDYIRAGKPFRWPVAA